MRYWLGCEEVELLLEQQRVGAEVDVLLARDEPCDDLVDLGMQQRLAAGDAHHRRAALVHGAQALLDRELLLQHVRRVLDLAAAGAGEVAAVERLEHQHERVARVAAQLLAQHVAGHGHIWEMGTGICEAPLRCAFGAARARDHPRRARGPQANRRPKARNRSARSAARHAVVPPGPWRYVLRGSPVVQRQDSRL